MKSPWNDRQLVDELERSLGRDLQFIRINGTLVGTVLGLGHGGRHAFGTQQAFEQCVHLAAHFMQAAKVANGALSWA